MGSETSYWCDRCGREEPKADDLHLITVEIEAYNMDNPRERGAASLCGGCVVEVGQPILDTIREMNFRDAPKAAS